MHGRAGDDQVANTGQTGEGLAVRADRHAQPGDLGKTARHEQGLGVVAVAHAVADTGAEGDDVLECRAQLDAGRVRAGVDAETAAHEGVLHALGKLPLRAGDDNARRDAAADLLGVRGAGQGDDGAAGLLRDKLRHAVAGTLLDALRHGDEQGRFGKVRRKGAGRGAHGERRRGEHDHLPALRAGGVGGIMQSLRQRDAGEIWILMGLGELLALRFEMRPKGDIVTVFMQQNGKGRAPAAAAGDRYLHGRFLTFSWISKDRFLSPCHGADGQYCCDA